jgi:hypothetical protein
MTKDQMESLVQRQLEAYNRRDLEKFCAQYHPEVVATNLMTGETLCRGMVQFTAVYDQRFSGSPELHCELKSRIVLEWCIIDEEYVTGVAQFPQGLHACAIYGFRDGRIDRVWFCR